MTIAKEGQRASKKAPDAAGRASEAAEREGAEKTVRQTEKNIETFPNIAIVL